MPKNFKMPKTINSYGEYLKYAGEASGVLPITPEAEAPTAAEGSLAAGPSSAVGVVLKTHCTAPGTSPCTLQRLHAELFLMGPVAA